MHNNNIKGAFNCGMICNTIDAVTHFLTGKEDVSVFFSDHSIGIY